MVVLATLLALGASIAWWASSTLADADTFATTATAALADDDVNELLAERLVDRFAGDTLLGTSGKPVAVELTRGVVRSDAFAGVFHASVRTAHEQLVSDRDDSVAVALAGAAPLLDPAVDPTDPADETVSSAAVAVVDSPVLVRIAHVLSVMDLVAWLCAGGWLLVSGVALFRAGDRRRMLRRLAGGLVVAGVVLVAAVLTVRAVAGYGDPADVHAAAATLVAVFTDPLLRLATVLVALGAIVGVCALSAPATGQTSRTAAVRAQSAWRHPGVRAAAPVLALLAGAALLLEPEATVAALVRVTGLALVVGATVVLVGWLVRVLDRGRPVADQPRAVRSMGATALTAVVVGALVAALLAGAAATSSVEAELPSADPDGAGCNGFVGLCDLRLDQVAFAGTHNAMSSSAEPGWFLADQRLPISGQLAAGVRAMMLDVYPGYVSDGRVRTDLRAPAAAEAAAADLTPEGRAALKDLGLTTGAIPPEGATIDAYLCHSHCELGASTMVDKLRDVGDFLAHNPNEVLIFILQDYIIGAQTQAVFEDAGLMPRVWPLSSGGPWPTLRQMIVAHRNIVVLSENHGGEVPWMPAAYDVTEETPYGFASPEDFTCTPNRGGTGKPLFLLNHWVAGEGSKRLEDAKLVNTRDFLTERLAACQRERGRQPGILAVDFVDMGDTVAVVTDLNRSTVGD
jgi:hypothetical protein